jgi:copper chaperone CopZ
MKKMKLTIQGMHCASCGSNIERSLKKIPGVKEASVSVMTKKGFIEADKDIEKSEIEKAVSRAGNYKLISLEKE